MVLSDEMREVGLWAISIALTQGQDVVDVPHLVAALTRPAADEPRLTGMTVFSENVSRVVGRAKWHAKAAGSDMTARRHLVAALLDLGDPAVTTALSGFEPGVDHVTRAARPVNRFRFDFEPLRGSARIQRRPPGDSGREGNAGN